MPAPSRQELAAVINLPPREAIDYLRGKGYRISWDWTDTWADAHARAFTVAKATKLEVLESIRGAVERALERGLTLKEFQRDLEPRLRALGWWGRQVVEGPDGTPQSVQLGSAWRLRTIYQTNLQTAYMAGRWRQMKANSERRPWWMYVAVMDKRTRASHAELNGHTFRHDDHFWEAFYPPLGFHCRCRVRALSEVDVRLRGIPTRSSEGRLRWRWRADPRTGAAERIGVYKGLGMDRGVSPDFGWGYNPGRAAWQPALERFPLALAQQYVVEAVRGPAFARFWAGASTEHFPVAVLPPAAVEAAGAPSGVVMLDAAALARIQQTVTLRDITLMHELPEALAGGRVVAEGASKAIEFASRGISYRARLEVRGGRKLYLVEIRRAS